MEKAFFPQPRMTTERTTHANVHGRSLIRFDDESGSPNDSAMKKYCLGTVSRGGLAGASIAALALLGCAAGTGVDRLPPVDPSVLGAMQANVADASNQLWANRDALQLVLERNLPRMAEIPSPAADDPLSRKTISISMQNARVGQLLWVLASEFGISLSVEPDVLDMPQVANLHLQKVTGRQALNHLLSIFDIYGRVGQDGVLVASMMEDRLFDVETLAGKTMFGVSAGGDSLGGGKDSGLKDSLSLSGEFGDKGDGLESLVKAVEAVLSDGQAGGAGKDKTRVTVDRGGGILFVRARPSKMHSVERLIEQGKTFRKRQIQIDAQLIDVQLNNGSELGIDWNLFSNHLIGRLGAGATSIVPNPLVPLTLRDGNALNSRVVSIPDQVVGVTGSTGAGLGLQTRTFSAVLNALRTFGNVKVLSNPTVRVRNGIPAYLSVGSTVRYVQKLTSTVTNSGGGGSTTSTDVITESLFSGVVVGVSALVKADGFVELFVKPSQSQAEAASLALVDVGSGNKVTLPVVNIKSIATTLNIRDGDTVVIGGLIDQQHGSSDSGVPGLSDMGGLGKLFGTARNQSTNRELVVVLRVRVL
jgi:general secretion pathway protein D